MSVTHYGYLISLSYRRKPMGHYKGRTVPGKVIDSILYLFFGHAVQCAGRLIEYNNPRVPDYSPCN